MEIRESLRDKKKEGGRGGDDWPGGYVVYMCARVVVDTSSDFGVFHDD